MDFLPKRNLLDGDNPLLKKLTPVVLTIACKGIRETSSKKLILATLFSLLITPIFWVIPLVGKTLHLIVVIAIWWLVRGEIAALGVSEYVALGLAIAAIYYKDIYYEVQDLTVHLVVILTGAGALRWMCNGYLSGDGLRERMIESTLGSNLISGIVVGSMPPEFSRRYNECMDLYLDSEDPESAVQLEQLLDEYSSQED